MIELASPTSQDKILAQWIEELLTALELEGTDIDIDGALSLAGEAAHAVVRPAAPLTTLVVGLAAGLAAGSGQASEQVALSSATTVARRLCRDRAADAEKAKEAAERTEPGGQAPVPNGANALIQAKPGGQP